MRIQMILTRDVIALNLAKNEWISEFETLLLAIEANVESEPDIAIESCKSLLESIAKTILNKLDATYNDKKANDTAVHTLLGNAKQLLLENVSENQEAIITRFTSSVQAINDVRNASGDISHGKKLPKEKRSSVQFAKTIKSFTDSFASYLLYLFLSIDFSYQEPPKYEDNQEFNEKLDEANPIGERLLYSKALFDQDFLVYEDLLDSYNQNKEQLIQELASSNSFSNTHSIIQELSTYFSWSDEQIIKLLKAADTNNQISSIIKDHDLLIFYKRVLNGKVEKMFELEELRWILERIGYKNLLQNNSDETE